MKIVGKNAETEREKLVRKLRTNMFRLKPKIQPDIMRQELYDLNTNEITELVTDIKVPFDSRLFFRSLEEIFKKQIYIFIPGETKNTFDFVEMEIPRNRSMHVRNFRNRECVIIIKHAESDENKLDNDQYELVVLHEKRRSPQKDIERKMFSPQLSVYLLDFFDKVYSSYYIRVDSIVNSTQNTISNNATIIKNYFRDNNPFDIIRALFKTENNIKFISQVIDGYGKLRAIIVQIDDFEYFTITIPPTQPINLKEHNGPLPLSNLHLVDKYIGSDKIVSVSRLQKTKITPKTKQKTKTKQNEILGFWFSLGLLTEGIFVPVKVKSGEPAGSLKKISKLPKGSPNPILWYGGSDSEEIDRELGQRSRKMKKTINIILQYVLLAFISYINHYKMISKIEVFRGGNLFLEDIEGGIPINSDIQKYIKEFTNKYFHINKNQGKSKSDSSTIYNIDMVERIFPTFYLQKRYTFNKTGEFIEEVINPKEICDIIYPNLEPMERILKYIKLKIPQLIVGTGSNSKLNIYSKKFGAGLEFFLLNFTKNTVPERFNTKTRFLKYKTPTKITEFYTSPKDFIQWKHNIIFINNKNLRKWQHRKKHEHRIEKHTIQTTISLGNAVLRQPFIYKGSISTRTKTVKNFYIIQNVVNWDKYRSLAVSKSWSLNKINSGYDTKPLLDEDTQNYIVYSIAEDGSLFPSKIVTKSTSKEYWMILKYMEKLYGAILPFV